MARRIKTTGSVYRRASDGRWFAAVDAGRTDDGRRIRRSVSSNLYCATLKRLSDELNAAHRANVERRDRAVNMDAARLLGTHTSNEWFAYLRQVGRVCEYCGNECIPTKDHRQPITRGGSDAIENLAVACFRCNTAKHNATEAEFRAFIEAEGGLAPGRERARARRTDRTRPDVDMDKVRESPAKAAARAKAAQLYPITVDDMNNWSCPCGAGPSLPNFPGRPHPTSRRNAWAASERHIRSHIRQIIKDSKATK